MMNDGCFPPLIRRIIPVLIAAGMTACIDTPPMLQETAPSHIRQSAYPEHVLEAAKKWTEIQPNISGSFGIVMETSSLEELLAIGKPTFVTYDGDLIWVGTGFGGKLTFMIDRVRRVQTDDQPEKWCILKPISYSASWGFDHVAVIELFDKKPVHDGGPGNYAVALSESDHGDILYEIGWQRGPAGSGNVTVTRPFYLLKMKSGKWLLVGEGPSESSGTSGRDYSYATYATSLVQWQGGSDHPVTISFKKVKWHCEIESQGHGAPWLHVYCAAILEGPYPAELRYTSPEYVVAEENDTLDKIAFRLAVWKSPYWQGKSRETFAKEWRDKLLAINADLSPDGIIKKGTVIYLETNPPSNNNP